MPVTNPGTAPACPICGRQGAHATRPFCSVRCADVDLGRWLTGQYRVPGPAPDAADDEEDGRAGSTRQAAGWPGA